MIRIDNIEYDSKKNEILYHGKNGNYVLAFVEFNKAHDEYDIRSVGKRCFELNSFDYEDFKDVLNLIEKKNKNI